MKRLMALVLLFAAAGAWAASSKVNAKSTPEAVAVTTPDPAATPAAPVLPTAKVGVLCKRTLEVTGYVKLDAIWDKTGTDSGNYARYVNVPSHANDIHRFNMTARETRLGLAFPTDATNHVGGKVEFDFYNASEENKNIPMLRHAYVEYDWASRDMNLLAGQTSDVISPLVEPTVNYTVGWWAGNIGYRRPQLRFSIGTGRKAAGRTLVQVAASRSIGSAVTISGVTADSGVFSGYPTLQGRLAQFFNLGKNKPSCLGVWGHWGEERTDMAVTYTTSCVGGDLELNLSPKASLKGEGFWGRDLAAFLGGIGQGLNTGLYKEIRGRGGWAALSFGPFGRTKVNMGGGFDKPCRTDVTAPTDRSWNRTAFLNTMVQVASCSRWGTEVSAWRTNYVSGLVGDSTRVQTAWYLDF